MDPQTAYVSAAVCLVLFGLLGAIDGIYFHMIKYKLHLHPPAKFEHQIHTFRGILFIPIIALFFYWNVSGPLLWLGIGLLFIDFIAELVDIAVEKDARAEIGGISSVEAAFHVTATGFRMAALAIVIVSKPIESFYWSTDSWTLAPYSTSLNVVAMVFMAGIGLALFAQIIMAFATDSLFICRKKICSTHS